MRFLCCLIANAKTAIDTFLNLKKIKVKGAAVFQSTAGGIYLSYATDQLDYCFNNIRAKCSDENLKITRIFRQFNVNELLYDSDHFIQCVLRHYTVTSQLQPLYN